MALNSNSRIDIDPTKLGRAALSLTPVGTQLPPSGQFDAAYKNFGPFLGIAWSPKVLPGLFGGGKTVIRTGFRLSYDDIFHNIPVNMGLNFPPLLSTTLPARTTPPFYSWGQALSQNRTFFVGDPTVPEGTRGILGFNAWDTTGRSAYAMNYAPAALNSLLTVPTGLRARRACQRT